jgi:transposase
MGTEIGKRLRWVQLVEQGKNCTQVCLQCGISRPTLRKWVERYRATGPDGLMSKSKRPHRSPACKVSEQERTWIAELRKRGLGSRRIQSELKRSYDLELSRPTIEKVFQSLEPRPRLVRRLARKGRKRYAKEIPGERVQMDTCKIAPGLYQYTAVDDCTRIRVLALYKRRSAANSLLFLEKGYRGVSLSDPTHTNRSRPRILRLRVPGEAHRIWHQVSSIEACFTPPQWQGRAVATHRFRGVLRDRGLICRGSGGPVG